MSRLIETEFFPKWLKALYSWLMNPGVKYEEVGEWYRVWKSLFEKHGMGHIQCVEYGWKRGLEMMGRAMGGDALPPLEYYLGDLTVSSSVIGTQSFSDHYASVISKPELTFREYLTLRLGEEGIEFVPSGRVNERGEEIYRVGGDNTMKGHGFEVYIENGVVWMKSTKGSEKVWEPVGVDQVIERAKSRNI